MHKFFSSHPMWLSSGLLITRIILGSFLIYHGWEFFDAEKIKEYQQWDAFKSSSGAFFGICRERCRTGCRFYVCSWISYPNWLFAYHRHHVLYRFYVGNGKVFSNDQHPVLFILISIVFIFTGPGKYSLDHLFFDKNKRASV